MSNFGKFKEEVPSKETFFSFLTVEKISDKECQHDFKVWNKFEMKTVNLTMM